MFLRIIQWLFCITSINVIVSLNQPEIYLTSGIKTIKLSKARITIDGSQEFKLKCSAAYPIKWIHEYFHQHVQAFPAAYTLWGERKFTDFRNSSTYRYESTISAEATDVDDPASSGIWIISCNSIEMPYSFEVVNMEYSERSTTVSLVLDGDNITTVNTAKVIGNPCPFVFRVRFRDGIYPGLEMECFYNTTVVIQGSVSSSILGSAALEQAFSRYTVQNPECLEMMSPEEECRACQYLPLTKAQKSGEIAGIVSVSCSVNKNLAVVTFSPTAGFQRSPPYMEGIELNYVKYPFYYTGEKVILTLSWYKYKYYCALGDLFLTLHHDGQLINTLTISYEDIFYWTDWDDSNPNLNLDQHFTKFNKVGLTVVTIYVPFWNSSKWMNSSAEFIVKAPEDLRFLTQSQEKHTFHVGDEQRNLTCDADGDPEHFTFHWKKEGNDLQILSHNKTLIFPVIVDSKTPGIYICTVQHLRSGQEIQKEFVVHVQQRNSSRATYLYILLPVLLIAFILTAALAGCFWRKLRHKAPLTESDIQEFKNGKQENDGIEMEIYSRQPYNKKYEVRKKQIKLDKFTVLGSGEFGVVYRGTVISLETLDAVEVAVKTVKLSADSTQIKSLLNELKVLSYLDNEHGNVLNIIAACTSRLSSGEILVCVELCRNNLLNTLRKIKDSDSFITATSFTSNPTSESERKSKDCTITMENLMIWAYQIAEGMEFLGRKQVIHGDLAARNILISTDFRIKIADFGLGRVMRNHEYFVAEEETPLPWRWMAVEALERRKFSTASDVWAFGVTLWEVFTLGQLPYSGSHYSLEFVQELIDGLRLTCPENGSHELFAILQRCWDLEPTNRPDFTQIKIELASLLQSSGVDTSGYLTLGLVNTSNKNNLESASNDETNC